MKTIGAAKFKETCLNVLDHLDTNGIVITKHNKPVAKLIPIRIENKNLIGSLKGKIKIKDDIFSTGLEWNAQS